MSPGSRDDDEPIEIYKNFYIKYEMVITTSITNKMNGKRLILTH